jgi:hypothetical protein
MNDLKKDDELEVEIEPEIEPEVETEIIKHTYLLEPVLNSELILFNNSKKLKKDKSLYNDKYLDEIEELREEYKEIYETQGLQKQKRDIRNRLRDLSTKTYVNRDPNIFGEMMLQIIDGIASRPNFSNYSYLNEMKSLAVEHILKYTWKFDPYKQSKITNQYISAFTYLTTITFNAFVATINKRNKEIEQAKKEYQETVKIKNKEPNKSTIGKDYTEIEKTVVFNTLKKDTLLENVKKIAIDVEDILIKIPEDYFISPDEFKNIYDYAEINKFRLSIKRLPLKGK